MTHSLHREGSVRSLKEDYVVLTLGGQKGILGSQKTRLRRKFPRAYARLREALWKLGIIRMLRIITMRKPKKQLLQGPVFTSREELCGCLKKLKEAHAGQSVVVSGLFDEVNNCLKEIDLRPHTVQFSLGHFGKTELLPRQEVLEITTMCGHHTVTPRLVEKLVSEIAKGNTGPKEAAQVMGKMCVCRIFNKTRAARLIKALAK